MKFYRFTESEITRLRLAVEARDQAEGIISEARKRLPGKNKTHAMRRLLGLCPECGTENIPSEGFYCVACRDKMTARHRKLANSDQP